MSFIVKVTSNICHGWEGNTVEVDHLEDGWTVKDTVQQEIIDDHDVDSIDEVDEDVLEEYTFLDDDRVDFESVEGVTCSYYKINKLEDLLFK